ncbi:MAG: queuosine precursor transporter [Granulosicoccus sp.]
MLRFPWLAVLAMAVVIVASNFLVDIPINDWLVWGALTYPFAFLVTDLVNRSHGAATARQVVYSGFAIGVVLSLFLADVRIAIASGTAFLCAQLLDVYVFDRLRNRSWWVAPGISSAISTVIDTLLFFALAFAGTGGPWLQWATGDLGVKWAVALLALIPYRLLASAHTRQSNQA